MEGEKQGRTRQLSEGSDTESKRTRAEEIPMTGIAASPPAFINFDKLMESLRKDTETMHLAHEIAVNSDFKMEKKEPQKGTLYSLVQQNLLRAYWDIIKADIAKDPPVLDMVIKLCKDMRQMLLDLLLPHQNQLREHITEIFDIDLIKQRCEAEKSIEPLKEYAPATLDMMQKLCCPMRDEEICALRHIDDTIELFQGITRVLEEMKLDFTNFLITQIRPILQENIVDFEKDKADKIETAQRLLGVDDPLKYTKKWLQTSYDDLFDPKKPKPSASAVLFHAYILLVSTNDYLNEDVELPETLTLDRERIQKIQQDSLILTITAAVILISQGYTSERVATPAFKRQIKETCLIVLRGVQCNSESDLREAMSDLATKIFQDIQKQSAGDLSSEQEVLFHGQITELGDIDHSVRKIIFGRVTTFLSAIAKGNQNVKIPPGLSALEAELTKLAADYLQIISLNRATHAEKYDSLITDIRDARQSSD